MSETIVEIISNYVVMVYFAILIISVIVFAVIDIRNVSKTVSLVERETRRLKELGLLVNHSYKAVSRDDGKAIRFRIIRLDYNSKYKCVVGTMYLCSKNDEIGIWKDKTEYLDSIPQEFDLTDLGTWSPSPQGIE